jgi:hypothetical protein
MHHFVLQDFTTIRGTSTTLTITQSESSWHDLSHYEDLVAWLDIREITLGNAASISFNLQTAPIKDEYLFVNMETTPFQATIALTAPKVRVITLAQLALSSSPVAVPLGKFVRWQLLATGCSSTWDATFRIILAANEVGSGGGRSPMIRPAGM